MFKRLTSRISGGMGMGKTAANPILQLMVNNTQESPNITVEYPISGLCVYVYIFEIETGIVMNMF